MHAHKQTSERTEERARRRGNERAARRQAKLNSKRSASPCQSTKTTTMAIARGERMRAGRRATCVASAAAAYVLTAVVIDGDGSGDERAFDAMRLADNLDSTCLDSPRLDPTGHDLTIGGG